MNKTFSSIITGGVIVLFLMVMLPCASGKERVFAGKVIDAETKAAIEGMVVVACWAYPKGKPNVKEIKETLTDAKGEWSIVGEEVEGGNLHACPSEGPRDYDRLRQQPWFIVFKPGYESYSSTSERYRTFAAYPCLDKKIGLEGIILFIDKKEVDYFDYLTSKNPVGSAPIVRYGIPFIPLKDAENKLKRLDIPFDYDPFKVKRLDWEYLHKNNKGLFYTYTLFGLKRLHKREDRARALINPIFEYFDDEPEKERELLRKQKNFLRLFVEESQYLGLNWHEGYIKKLGEN